MNKMLHNDDQELTTDIVDKRNNCIKIQRNLNIHQKGVTKQLVPIEFAILYPRLALSTHNIHFGNVYIGNTKKSILTLKNETSKSCKSFTNCSKTSIKDHL